MMAIFRSRLPLTELQCPYCREKFELHSFVLNCYKCRTPHHDSCWLSLNACSVFGCGGTTTVEHSQEKRLDRLIGISLITIWAVITAMMSLVGKGLFMQVLIALNLGLLGMVLLLSYFFTDRSFLFRWVMKIIQNIGVQKKEPQDAIAYAAVLIIIAILVFLSVFSGPR